MAAVVEGAVKNWADDEDDEYGLPPKEEILGEDGLKRVIEWSVNEEGYAVKTTTVVKIEKNVKIVSKGVAERTNWKKFGVCAGKPPGLEKGVSKPSPDEILIEWILPPADDDEEQEEDDEAQREIDIRKMLNADRLRQRMSERSAGVQTWAQLMALKAGADKDEVAADGDKPAASSGKYISPALKNREQGADGRYARDDSATVRVSNIPPRTTEADLSDLFRTCGRISRTFLSRDRNTGDSKGFAYVAYESIADAERAIQKLDGHGYDHLILRVEWADAERNSNSGAVGATIGRR
uniref:Eukaryotic translation initiation factor 3 subunit G n=1 Tax=Timspurckia oligopyrenoides TaxID=708627 RepID=A0A7S1EQI3_9RHOD|mmetsp:Transcript_12918/g.23231  ORF Transcript_12918/g.23231 Transcript_12918/m.23231 type:complete len:295 (+) Transcript_12918:62-946(+)|eukprot:CAMPEP_0182446948 /NCGR_PEP_ID=MMETSP1172-20130603/9128_1 /TAXON_ID=708627 /ORGANISM="Timspurckia oligopyrenoides, Strain CCMP3278" /LENGTH=294 /DNA_ID=CAMNT_0024643145 /DNA_START=37 /DNA_END=921 /DNA_ORIENTATION=-